jgi:hypothetical protein
MAIPCDLHPENVMRRTKVLHCELHQHLPSELGKLFDMSTGEQHIIHIKDEEDGTPVGCTADPAHGWFNRFVLTGRSRFTRIRPTADSAVSFCRC